MILKNGELDKITLLLWEGGVLPYRVVIAVGLKIMSSKICDPVSLLNRGYLLPYFILVSVVLDHLIREYIIGFNPRR